MAAANYDMTIEQGALFELTLTFQDTQVPPAAIDITGYTFEGQIRTSHDAKTATASFQFTILDQSSPTTKGKVRVFIPSTVTAEIAVKSSEQGIRKSETFLYDIYATALGGDKARVLQGKAVVSGEVTK